MDSLGIPRMYRSSGTSDPETFKAIGTLVDDLKRLAVEQGDQKARALLHDLHRGDVSFLEALQMKHEEGMKGVTKLSDKVREAGFALTMDALDEYMSAQQHSETTRVNYRHNLRTMLVFARSGESLKDVPQILVRYRAACVSLGRNFRAFNLTRAITQGWVAHNMGNDSETYQAIRKIKRLKEAKKHGENQYYSPKEISALAKYLPKEIGDLLLFQLLHNMNAKELLVDGFEVVGSVGLHIFGKKTKYRDRIVPLMMQPPVIPEIAYNRYYDWLRSAAKAIGWEKFGTHDARRSGMRWQERAGIPKSVVSQFAGKAPQDLTDQYLYANNQPMLRDYRDKYFEWLKIELEGFEPPKDAYVVKQRTAGMYGKRESFDAARKQRRNAAPVKLSPMLEAVQAS